MATKCKETTRQGPQGVSQGFGYPTFPTPNRDNPLQANPRYGASWEGFALEKLISILDLSPEDLYFYRTHGGAEMDLVLRAQRKLYGFEFKVTEKPAVTHSMTVVPKDLGLDNVYLVYPGELSFPLRDGMWAVGYQQLPQFSLGS